MSAPRSGRSARKRGLVSILALVAALLALAPMSAYGDSGDDPAADAAATEATAADRFTVSAAEATALRAARPAKAKGTEARRARAPRALEPGRPDLGRRRARRGRLPAQVHGRRRDGHAERRRRDERLRAPCRRHVQRPRSTGSCSATTRSLPTPCRPSPKSKTKEPKTARLTITNHPIGGPVFAGEQLQPWICARRSRRRPWSRSPGTSLTATVNSRVSGLDDDPVDDQCNAAPKYTYFYQPTTRKPATLHVHDTGRDACFEPYDLAIPPAAADIANFTNDRGDTVKSIIRVERGTIEPRHLRARHVLRPDAAERALGAAEGLERQALLDLRRLERRSAASRRRRAPRRRPERTRRCARLHGRDLVADRPRHELERHARRRDDDDGEGADRRDVRRDPLHDRRRLLGRLDHAAEHRRRVSRAAERHPAELHASRTR